MQIFGDHQENALWICQYIIIPKPHDTITLSLQKVRPNGILLGRSIVLAAIDFDNQPGFVTHEVSDISADGTRRPNLNPWIWRIEALAKSFALRRSY